MTPYRILIVDDSAFMRKLFSDIITQDSSFTIVGTASTGAEAVRLVEALNPDAVTLDLEMPEMNGLEALKIIMAKKPTPVIMLSGISEDNTRQTIAALQLGAFDFIRKPSGITDDIASVAEALIIRLKLAVSVRKHQPVLKIPDKPVSLTIIRGDDAADKKPKPQAPAPPPAAPQKAKMQDRLTGKSPATSRQADVTPAEPANPLEHPAAPLKPTGLQKAVQPGREAGHNAAGEPFNGLTKPRAADQAAAAGSTRGKTAERTVKPDAPPAAAMKKTHAASFRHLVAIGTSTGGPRALHQVLSSLPGSLPAPVLIVQHMPPKFTHSLAQRLDSYSELTVKEAEQGDVLAAGVVYIAPGGYHMKLQKDGGLYRIRLTEDPARNGHRPSVDVLFESLLPYSELNRHAVIMTGMGSDGAKGMKALAENGAKSTIAESEETCIVYGMPRSAVEGGAVKTVLPLQGIAGQIVSAVMK
ncbi:chemotaxis response regulator protein-glutamate methylesterase [Paenibacillus sambharensis]|uniref:Protein-glutamate methylesterase/protein-glutamine glutaminase n=1 Tax=Paenibacillus sambharensis TaxID=1803190 RepID=A0A2W1L2Q2_9BACL|nr:chemotaxis response regulator protein-glutamate methylesterase [Paenibacillus sambharensis]PZD93343.1 chemotaxis response regulator protein-glutamate methylesterase [Paenibacillus sambharensis]